MSKPWQCHTAVTLRPSRAQISPGRATAGDIPGLASRAGRGDKGQELAAQAELATGTKAARAPQQQQESSQPQLGAGHVLQAGRDLEDTQLLLLLSTGSGSACGAALGPPCPSVHALLHVQPRRDALWDRLHPSSQHRDPPGHSPRSTG